MSGGIYASLNCGVGSRDDADSVRENLDRVAASFGIQRENLLGLYQIHSADVLHVTRAWDADDRPKADAMVTGRPGLALAISTADCVPVLFADRKRRVIGAAHAGWKGALSGIICNTVEAMLKLGAELDSIATAIGPAITQKSYEVDSVFRQKILDSASANSGYFAPSVKPGHWMFDLKGYVRSALAECGVQDINTLENDTYIEEDSFFSFRRTTHRGEPDYGRQLSVIMLNP